MTVTIDLNPAWSTVATGLDPVPGEPAHTFAAADFDVLYDSPILMGNLESLPPFEVRGVRHDFVGYALGDFDRAAFMKDLKAIVEAGVDIIGEVPYSALRVPGHRPGEGRHRARDLRGRRLSGVGADRRPGSARCRSSRTSTSTPTT